MKLPKNLKQPLLALLAGLVVVVSGLVFGVASASAATAVSSSMILAATPSGQDGKAFVAAVLLTAAATVHVAFFRRRKTGEQ